MKKYALKVIYVIKFLIIYFKKTIKWLAPYGIIYIWERKRDELLKVERLRNNKRIREYFLNLNPDNEDSEIKNIISYFKENPNEEHPFSMLPIQGINQKYYNVFYDNASEMHYVFHKNKKMYFPRVFNVQRVNNYYTHLCMEQEENSPHRYESENFVVKEGDIIADIGAAEGIWALDNIDNAKKIYLFECNMNWIEALQKTFEPYKEKVLIVNKYVSDKSYGIYITIDDYFQNERLDFIKADIEGMEPRLLEGAVRTLFCSGVKLLLCTYHEMEHAEELKKRFEELGFITEFSKGYMIWNWGNAIGKDVLRRGVIKARKKI